MKVYLVTVFRTAINRDVLHAAFDALENAKEYAESHCKLPSYCIYEMEINHLNRKPYITGPIFMSESDPLTPSLRNDNSAN